VSFVARMCIARTWGGDDVRGHLGATAGHPCTVPNSLCALAVQLLTFRADPVATRLLFEAVEAITGVGVAGEDIVLLLSRVWGFLVYRNAFSALLSVSKNLHSD
jgi:hypothetical protein